MKDHSDSAEIERRFDALSQTVLAKLTEWTDQCFATLNERERIVIYMTYLDGEITNGGFDQWLTNPTGMHAQQTRAALLELRLPEVAQLVSHAMRGTRDLDQLDAEFEQWRPKIHATTLAYWNQSEST